jgi:hypothetical protein
MYLDELHAQLVQASILTATRAAMEGDRYVVATDGPGALLGVLNEMRPVKASALP